MRTGFDLSPVIDLLDALSPSPPNPFVLDQAAAAAAAGVVRSLGDFSALWEFLEDCRSDDSTAPPAHLHKELTPPPSPPPPTHEKKKRRKKNATVTFDDSAIDHGLSSATDFAEYTDTTEEIPRAPNPRTRFSSTFTATTRTPRVPSQSDGLAAVALDAVVHRPVIRSQLSSTDRKAQLIQMIAALFPADAPSLLCLNIPRSINPSNSNIHVFVDNSNITIGFYELIKKIRGYPKNARVRAPGFSFHNLTLILERGRETAKKALVGSLPITTVIREAEALGYETSILERVHKERGDKHSSSSSGSESAATKKTRMAKVEQAVDEILHLKILESILDFPPSTIVLASGDAAAGEYSPGFFKVVERALTRGWNIELASFKKSLSFQYNAKEFKEKWKGSFKFIPLDQFAELLLNEGPTH